MKEKVEDIFCWTQAVLHWAETMWKSETRKGYPPVTQGTQVSEDQDTVRWKEKEREVFLWLTQSRSLTLGAPVLPRQMLVFVNIPPFPCFCSSITKHLWHSTTCTALRCSQTCSKGRQVEEHNQKEDALRYSGDLYYDLQPWRLKKNPNNSSPIFSLFFFPYIIIEITPSFSQK